MKTLLASVALGLALVVFSGCGGSGSSGPEVKGAKVSGVLLFNGKPIEFQEMETITISFESGEGESQIATSAEVNAEDGSFTLEGPTGQGIPAGKYRIQVVGDIYGGDEPNRFERYFEASEDVTIPQPKPLNIEISESEGQNVEIDLGKWTAKLK